MGLFDRFRRRESPFPFGFSREAVVDSVLHPSSFSLVVFRGDQAAQIPALLAACGYTVLREGRIQGGPIQLRDGLVEVRDGSIVMKGYWSTPEMTVLIDPEMIVSTASEQQLAAFCGERQTEAICAVWERVSETAMFIEIEATGVRRKTWYQQGAPFEPQIDPRAEIVGSPDSDGLRAALAAAGVDVELLFSQSEAIVLELRE